MTSCHGAGLCTAVHGPCPCSTAHRRGSSNSTRASQLPWISAPVALTHCRSAPGSPRRRSPRHPALSPRPHTSSNPSRSILPLAPTFLGCPGADLPGQGPSSATMEALEEAHLAAAECSRRTTSPPPWLLIERVRRTMTQGTGQHVGRWQRCVRRTRMRCFRARGTVKLLENGDFFGTPIR
jgi:hypothetical protein